MKLRLSQIFYLILAIPIALSPLFPVTANASAVDGLTTDPLFVIPDSVDEFNLAISTTAPVEPDSWPMAAANPERTSWTPEEVRGKLSPEWYKPFEPYIPQKVQIIAAYGMLYISTANGLYALDAETGAEKWVYPTELPLGHSPTIHNGVAYVGGFDHKLHAVDAISGQGLWTFEAEKGFQTNPLVVDGIVYAGNRDGYMYAVGAHGTSDQGRLIWRYKTGGPVLFSAAYKDGVIYFASNDSYAYALNAQNGSLVWKSDKLPGAGFHSWWPVVYRDKVIFSGSNNYRVQHSPFDGHFGIEIEKADVYPNYESDPRRTLIGPLGEEPGDWAIGTTTINTSLPNYTSNGSTTPITEYFEEKPWRRTYFVLDSTSGEEATYDFDNDGQPEYAPILWFGTHSGNRFPPVVGSDGVIYQSNNYMSDPWIPGGNIAGWKMDTPFISIPTSVWNAIDEPQAYAGGGNLIYWSRCCDRYAAAIDITQPGVGWTYFSYDLHQRIPGYDIRYTLAEGEEQTGVQSFFNGPNGVYGYHGDTTPPIPYNGKVYMHRSNAIIALGPESSGLAALPWAQTIELEDNVRIPTTGEIESILENEIEKILSAGHLLPGYITSGIMDHALANSCGDDLHEYWHHPADTIYTLLMALPHLPVDLQQETRAYIQNEFNSFPPYEFNHIGWRDGVPRETYILPPDVSENRDGFGPRVYVRNWSFEGWKTAPYTFYAMWKYAEVFGGAQQIFDIAKSKPIVDTLNSVPSNGVLTEMPYILNAYIAGILGYLELEDLAGYPETPGMQAEYNRLLNLRVSTFSIDTPYQGKNYCRGINTSRNFIFMIPELAQYLHDHALNKAQQTIDEYQEIAPYWFVSKFEGEYGESVLRNLYDYQALFQAKAWILKEPHEELIKYLDVPAVERGDLFFIQNLVSLLEAGSSLPDAPMPEMDPNGGIFDQPVSVTINSTIQGASIHYSLDGTTPTTSSPLYVAPITLYSSAPIKAQVFLDGYNPSAIASVDFILNHTFNDVPFDHWAYDHIESLYQSSLVAGCSAEPRLYCPDRILSRAESSVFILRGTYGAITDPPHASPDTPTFSDVDPAFWGYGWIESLWQDGFTSGCSSDPLSFCPEGEHTRAEGSVFFLRIKYGADYEPPTPQGIFADVTTDAWYFDWVEAAYNEGILPACQVDPLRFCPEDFLDRAWAAFMMIQAKGLGSSGATSTQSPTPTSTPTQPNPPASTPMPTETTSSTSTPTLSP